jgi:signal transduction histidine kinase
VTAAAVGWAGVLLAPHWAAVAAATLLYGLTFPFCRRWPQLAVLGEIAAELAGWALGVPPENPAGLVPLVGALFCLGRFAAGRWLALPALTLPTIALLRDWLGFSSMAFVLLLVLLIWGTGAVVRGRAQHAEEARREAAALAAADPVARAGRLVAEERARLAGEVLGVVRAAVRAMLLGAQAAARTLDPAACAAVQAEGRRAVNELRRLLGLLRSETEPLEQPEQPEHRGAAPWRVDLLIAAAAVAAVVVEWIGGPGDRSASSLALSLGLVAGLPLLRTAPALACLISTVPLVVSIAVDARPFQGLETAVVAVAVGWAAAADGRRLPLVALGGWALTALAEIRLHEPGYAPMLLALVAVGVVPGHLWRVRHTAEVLSLSTADRLRSRHAEVAERAVRAERLRLAREMHDVVSHAVGVMVLQAAAAEVQCGRDPAAARSALDVVRTAGLQAETELEVLFGLLDGGAVGTAGLADLPPTADLPARLRALADRMRGAGVRVEVACDDRPVPSVAAAGTAYRVVQEALTNAARHAAGSTVQVRLGREGDELVVEITDDGAGSPTDLSGGGFGLVGLAERVRAEGGRLAAGPRAEGGFGVTARLPLRPARREAPA